MIGGTKNVTNSIFLHEHSKFIAGEAGFIVTDNNLWPGPFLRIPKWGGHNLSGDP